MYPAIKIGRNMDSLFKHIPVHVKFYIPVVTCTHKLYSSFMYTFIVLFMSKNFKHIKSSHIIFL